MIERRPEPPQEWVQLVLDLNGCLPTLGEPDEFCSGCLRHWDRSCRRDGCWLAEFERTKAEA